MKIVRLVAVDEGMREVQSGMANEVMMRLGIRDV